MQGAQKCPAGTRLPSSAPATSAASWPRCARAASSATSCCSTSPRRKGCAKGKALDLEQNGAVLGYDAGITGTSNWADCAGADVVIITAGVPRKPGMSRDDLLGINLKIIRNVGENLKKHCPDAFVIVVSNPLDAMVYELKTRDRLPGQARSSAWPACSTPARFQLFLAREAGVAVKDVRAMVLGGHGDTMVPVLSYCTINGIPVTPADRGRQAGRDRRPHAQRRRRDRQADGDQRLLRARVGGRRDGDRLPEGREAPAAGGRVPERRIRLQGPVHRRARRHRRAAASRRSSRSSCRPRRRRCSTSRRRPCAS